MTVHFDNDSQATLWARQWLEDRADKDEARNFAIVLLIRDGYGVVRPCEREEWLTPKELQAQFAPHLSSAAFWYRLHPREGAAPPPFFLARRGPTGRIVEVQPNPVLIDYLAQPARPGRRKPFAA